MSERRSTRRGALARSLAFVGGLVGLAAAPAAAARPGTLVLYGQGLRLRSRERRPDSLPRVGDRLTASGDLFDRPGGTRVGALHAAVFELRGAAAGDPARLELHTFVLDGGTIVGSGAAGAEGTFAILGGTGRYAGARGTYAARQSHHELGGDGTAEFVLTLL